MLGQPVYFLTPDVVGVHLKGKAREGVTQLGTTEPKVRKEGLAWLRPGNDETVIKLRDMPVPQLPEK